MWYDMIWKGHVVALISEDLLRIGQITYIMPLNAKDRPIMIDGSWLTWHLVPNSAACLVSLPERACGRAQGERVTNEG